MLKTGFGKDITRGIYEVGAFQSPPTTGKIETAVSTNRCRCMRTSGEPATVVTVTTAAPAARAASATTSV